MAIFVSTASAAAGGQNVSLVSVQYTKGGIVLIFNTSGLTKADLKNAYLYADSNRQNLSCNFVDDSTRVRCVVSKSLAGEGGFYVTLAGFSFQGQLPAKKSAVESTAACGQGEVLWINLAQYRSGVLWWTQQVTASMWAFYQTTPAYAQDIQNGYTYEVGATFCAPEPTSN